MMCLKIHKAGMFVKLKKKDPNAENSTNS